MQNIWLIWIGIVIGTVALAGGSMGVYRALHRIYGISAGTWFLRPEQPLSFRIDSRKRFHTASFHFGCIPAALLAAGVWGFCGGTMWWFLSNGVDAGMKEAFVITGASAGFGILYAWAVRAFFVRNRHYSHSQHIIAAGILSSLAFGIGGWGMYGLNAIIVMAPIGWLIGLITTIFVVGDAFEDLDKTVSHGILVGILISSLLGIGGWVVVRLITVFLEDGDVGALLGQAGLGVVVLAIGLTLAAVFLHAPLSLVARLWLLLTFLIVNNLEKLCDHLLTPLLIRVRFRAIICNQCLRYSHPIRASYEGGARYCEHCRQDVEYTRERGSVIVVFGTAAIERKDRVFLIKNPDFEQNTQPIDIAEVHLDTAANPLLVERFLTYIVNYPPENGLKSVRVFHQGPLRELGGNLENALQNNLTIDSAG